MASRKKKPKQPPAPRVVLAADPGSSAGLALYVDGKFWGSKAVNGTSHIALYDTIMLLLDGCHLVRDLCVIEDGFGKGIGAKTLDRRRGLIMGAAQAAGFQNFTFVSPSTWHSAMLVSRESAAMKSEAMLWCKERLGFSPTTHDEAEACCIGFWACERYGK